MREKVRGEKMEERESRMRDKKNREKVVGERK